MRRGPTRDPAPPDRRAMSAPIRGATSPERPALEGGTPVRATLLPFFRPSLGREEEQAVVAVLRSGWLTTGPACARFEAAFRAEVGARHAVGVASCTAGLHLILHAAGIGAGDEVVVPADDLPRDG